MLASKHTRRFNEHFVNVRRTRCFTANGLTFDFGDNVETRHEQVFSGFSFKLKQKIT